MYYEEAVIDGVLHFRGTPDGEWRKLSAEAITLKYMEAKREAAQPQRTADATPCPECGKLGGSHLWSCSIGDSANR